MSRSTGENSGGRGRISGPDLLLAGIALAAVIWAILRACLQSITMDEAMTYRAFVAPVLPEQWAAHSNNHILNSLLIRLTTRAFGVSPVTVRLPALLGASLFVGGTYAVCVKYIASPIVRLLTFICVVFNPFVADYYAVARGYSLAAGFLVCAIALFKPSDVRRLAVASALLGLSFLSSFAFAFADLAFLIGLGAWALGPLRGSPIGRWLRALVAATAPFGLVVGLFGSWTLLHWPKGQLFYGSRSLWEATESILRPSLHEPNIEIVNPFVVGLFRTIGPWLAPALVSAVVLHVLVLLTERRHMLDGEETSRAVRLSALTAGATAVALLAHWFAFRIFGLLLPKDRTGLYVVIMFTLAGGALASLSGPGRLSRLTRHLLCCLLGVVATYYVSCLRLNYFHEWWICADMKEVYSVFADYNHRYGARATSTRAPFTDCLEFYRRVSGRETFDEITEAPSLQYPKDLYALYESQDGAFVKANHLKVVYRGTVDHDVVVAVRPGLDRLPPHRPNEDPTSEFYDDTDPRIEYRGQWTPDSQFQQALSGTVTYSNDPRASFRLRFEGTSAKYYYTRAPNRGAAEILIDGKSVKKIGLFSSHVEWAVSTSIEGLKSGQHLMEVHSLPPNNPKAPGRYIDVDMVSTRR